MDKVGINAFKYLVEQEDYNKDILSMVYNSLLSEYDKDEITTIMLKEGFKIKKRKMFDKGHLALRYLVEEEGYDREIVRGEYFRLLEKANKNSDLVTVDLLRSAVDEQLKKDKNRYTGYNAYDRLIEEESDKNDVYRAYKSLLREFNNDESRITLNMLKEEIENNISKRR